MSPGVRPAVEVHGLSKRYRGANVDAVRNLSFEVGEGQLFCLLGPNGAGKTTTFTILTTILNPTAGKVLIGGRDLMRERAAIRRDLGIVFQQPSLDLNLTAEENIRLHAVLYGLYPWRPTLSLMPSAYHRQLEELVHVIGLEGALGRPARLLSGGTRRKLEIVRALMHRPRVLFLDEPTAGLDPESRLGLWSYLRESRRLLGTTVFLTTHHLEESEEADLVCVMSQGQTLKTGSPAEIKSSLTPELVLDACDRPRLLRELAALHVASEGSGPFRVRLDGSTAQTVLRRLDIQLTLLRIVEPTLEDAYIDMLRRTHS